MREYDRHVLETAQPGAELLESINNLKSVELGVLLPYLYPVLTMLLAMIGNGVETLQVAAFRAVVNIITRYTEVPRHHYQLTLFPPRCHSPLPPPVVPVCVCEQSARGDSGGRVRTEQVSGSFCGLRV